MIRAGDALVLELQHIARRARIVLIELVYEWLRGEQVIRSPARSTNRPGTAARRTSCFRDACDFEDQRSGQESSRGKVAVVREFQKGGAQVRERSA